MRKWIILFLLVFPMFQFAYGESEKTSTADPNEWDFGQVKQGVILKHDFVLKNQTNDILEIDSIHTSCGCTVSQSEKKSLLPQETSPNRPWSPPLRSSLCRPVGY